MSIFSVFLINVTLLCVSIVLFYGRYHYRRANYSELHANFANFWLNHKFKLIVARDGLLPWNLQFESEDLRRFRNHVLDSYNADIVKAQMLIEQHVACVPRRLRNKLNCPSI